MQHTCLDPRLTSRIFLHHYFIQGGRLSQSNPEVINMPSLCRHLVLKIPLPLVSQELELQIDFYTHLAFRWGSDDPSPSPHMENALTVDPSPGTCRLVH